MERVIFNADSDLEEDFDLAAWPLIRPLVDEMNVRLRKAVSLSAAPAPEPPSSTAGGREEPGARGA